MMEEDVKKALPEREITETDVQEEPLPENDGTDAQKEPPAADEGPGGDQTAPPKPVVLKDVYGDQYRLGAPQQNGCRTVTHGRDVWTLLPIPNYPNTDCAELSDLYTLTRDDGSGGEIDVEEILLPASEIESADDESRNGVILSRDLGDCLRGDDWHPDWLSTDRVWRMLARVADGVERAVEMGVCPFKLTRDRLFVEEAGDGIYLAIARAGRVTREMRCDPWLAAVLPPELRDPARETVEAAQSAFIWGTLVLSLLADWTPDGSDGTLMETDGDGHIAAVSALPGIFPLCGELTEMLMKTFSETPADRPAPGAWRDLLNRCADEMRRRLEADPEEESDEIEDMDEAAFVQAESQRGGRWLFDAGRPVCAARLRFKAYCLPEDQWQLWNPRLDALTQTQRDRFAVLRFPTDSLQWEGARYVLFEDRTPPGAQAFAWSDYQEKERLQENLEGALRLIAALIDDISLAQKMGIDIGALSQRQLINLPEAAVAVCGENIRDGCVMPPADVCGHLLSGLAGTALMTPELNRLLAGEARAEADSWARLLRYAADHIQTCRHCGRRLMPGAICPDCGFAALVFDVRRDMEPEHEKTALPADGSEISLASLYSGEADVPAISFAWDETQRCYLATNLSERDWKYRLGNQDGLLGARRSMALLPGIRLSLLPRRLELMYDWPQ